MKEQRSTFSFDPTTATRLSELARKKHVSNTEVLRRALALYDYIESERSDESGGGITFVDKAGKEVKVILP